MILQKNTFNIILLFLLSSCKDATLIEDDKTKIIGSYKATTFVEPGSHDAGVDILQAGGKFTVIFKENLKVTGNLFIPNNINSNFQKGDKNFSGSITVNIDTIRFQGTGTLLDNPQLFFIYKNSSIESGDIIGRGGLFKIIFVKQLTKYFK